MLKKRVVSEKACKGNKKFVSEYSYVKSGSHKHMKVVIFEDG
jgi:hypothetical protein